MNKFFSKKNILAYIIINTIPIIILLIHVFLDLGGKIPSFKDILFIYNFVNSGILSFIIIRGEYEIFKFFLILLYNIFIIYLILKIKFIKNNFIIFIFIYSIISSILGLILFGALMSV